MPNPETLKGFHNKRAPGKTLSGFGEMRSWGIPGCGTLGWVMAPLRGAERPPNAWIGGGAPVSSSWVAACRPWRTPMARVFWRRAATGLVFLTELLAAVSWLLTSGGVSGIMNNVGGRLAQLVRALA